VGSILQYKPIQLAKYCNVIGSSKATELVVKCPQCYTLTCQQEVFTALRLRRVHPGALPSFRTLNPSSPFPLPSPRLDSEHKIVNASIFFMSSTAEEAQSTSSTSNIQSIIDAALANYTKLTGIDLSETPFATALEQLNSPGAVLQLLQDQAEAFKEYRDGNRKLIDCLGLAVNVIHTFSGIIGYAVSHVSHTCRCHLVSLLTVTLSDPISTSKSFACWNRYSS
jgi:STAND-like protein